jgi:hypothetical protein
VTQGIEAASDGGADPCGSVAGLLAVTSVGPHLGHKTSATMRDEKSTRIEHDWSTARSTHAASSSEPTSHFYDN